MSALRSYENVSFCQNSISDDFNMQAQTWSDSIHEVYYLKRLETDQQVKLKFNEHPITEPIKPDNSENKKATNFKSLLDVYGVIFDIQNDTVAAHIYEHDGEYSQDIEFSASEFEESDKHLVKENSVFYWKVGAKTVGGTSKNISEFRMRRLVTHSFPINKKMMESLSKDYQRVLGTK